MNHLLRFVFASVCLFYRALRERYRWIVFDHIMTVDAMIKQKLLVAKMYFSSSRECSVTTILLQPRAVTPTSLHPNKDYKYLLFSWAIVDLTKYFISSSYRPFPQLSHKIIDFCYLFTLVLFGFNYLYFSLIFLFWYKMNMTKIFICFSMTENS